MKTIRLIRNVVFTYITNLIHSNLEESDIKLILDCAPRYNEKEIYPEFSTKSYSSLTKYNRARESLE